jgi:iron complex transport system ATP-binding protein
MTLSADHITVKIGEKTLLNDVSITVKAGEVLAVIGPNGAGKSTLLNVITGDVSANVGHVSMNDRPLSSWTLRDRAKVRGILAQNVPLSFSFNVLEVVLMGRSPHIQGREQARDYEIATHALLLAGVNHLRDRAYTSLSGGERQRVQLARVLAQIWEPVVGCPRYLLMDEPTNNLDLTHQHSALKVARKFADEGVGVMVILHDLNLAAEYAHHILLLHEGQMLDYGTPEAVLTQHNIRQAYLMDTMITQHPVSGRPLVVPLTNGVEDIVLA